MIELCFSNFFLRSFDCSNLGKDTRIFAECESDPAATRGVGTQGKFENRVLGKSKRFEGALDPS